MLPIFTYITVTNIHRQKQQHTQLLLEKSAALAKSVEAGARAGLKGGYWGKRKLQNLLVETALQPDIQYIAVTNSHGRILAHNNPDRIGEKHGQGLSLNQLLNETDLKWRLVTRDETDLFEGYGKFIPTKRLFGQFQGHEIERGPHASKSLQNNDTQLEDTVIFVGLDVSAIQAAGKADLHQTIIMATILLLICFSGIIFVFMTQRYKTTEASLSQEIIRNQRLASIGRVAAGVAHEVRNPLSSIKGFATYLQQRSPDNPEDQEMSQILIQEVDRLNKVITQLLEVARPVSISGETTLMHDFIKDTLKLIEKKAAEHRVQIEVDLSHEIREAHIDRDRMKQVMLNLYLNALDVMPENGRLKVILSKRVDPITPGHDTGAEMNREFLEIQVVDSGKGIAPIDLPHVFDPYFTTKNTGTGLGLAIVYNIIKAHGGKIKAESKPGLGSTVTVLLPLSKP